MCLNNKLEGVDITHRLLFTMYTHAFRIHAQRRQTHTMLTVYTLSLARDTATQQQITRHLRQWKGFLLMFHGLLGAFK